jgi:23S rRNA pseudouridine1911/1915/1917 synthase
VSARRIEFVATPEHLGERLDVALAGHAAVGSRAAAQRLLDGGAVTVDGAPQSKSHRLSPGERVEAELPEPATVVSDAGEGVPFEVVFEDEHLLVVDKPAGVVVHPAPGHASGTLAQALANRGAAGGSDPWRPGIVHRLDRDTSGLLVLARSEAVHAALQAALRERHITREYLALVEGRPAARSGTIDSPLGRDRRVRTRMSSDTDNPRHAITHFETERTFEDSTLLRVRLETGRTHQIRAHLLAIGNPVAGDPEYGRPGFGLARQFLHAARLAFTHPVGGEPLELLAPLPEDLEEALRLASGERAGPLL